MNKMVKLSILSTVLFMSTGCVSETLGLNTKADTNATAMQAKESEMSNKLDNKAEKKIDGLFDKALGKIGL